MKYLVDSDWLIDALAGVSSAANALTRLASDGVATSIIAVGEIYDGAYGFPDPAAEIERYRRYLMGFTVLGLSEPVMATFARVRSSLRSQGMLIPDLDLLIAATALMHNLTLLTRNVRHYQRIAGITLYQP